MAPISSDLAPAWRRLSDPLRRFGQNRRGAILVLFALMAAVLFMFVGMAIDVTIAVRFRYALQDAVDAAALAGAGKLGGRAGSFAAEAAAEESMAESLRRLPSNDGVAFAVTPFATDGEGTTTAYNCRVVAHGKVRTTLLSMVTDYIQVSAAATAVSVLSGGDGDLEAAARDASANAGQGNGGTPIEPIRYLQIMAMGPPQRFVRLTQ